MTTAADLTVVIPTYNRLPLLKRALASVFAQTAAPARIIVAVDGSTDGTVEWLATLGGRVTVLVSENGGSAAAMNKGWYRRRVVIPASMVIAAVGLYWTLVRVVAGTNF